MSEFSVQELEIAWQRIDERLKKLQQRHFEKSDIALYEAGKTPPATKQELRALEQAMQRSIPQEISYSLYRSNGCEIAHDYAITFYSVQDLTHLADCQLPVQDDDAIEFDQVVGPINPIMESKKRYAFGFMDRLERSTLYLDYEDPPNGGKLGQVIRVGEDGIAKFVALSFIDFLKLVANAPCAEDDPDFNPLEGLS